MTEQATIRRETPGPSLSLRLPVRGLTPGPIDARRRLAPMPGDRFETAFELYRAAMAPTRGDAWNDAEQRDDFSRLLARVPGFFIVIDETPAGVLQVLPRVDLLHVVNIGLAPAWQGAGHGLVLIDSLQQAARQRRCGLHLKAYRSNPRARDFYIRHGFTVSHSDTRHWWLDWRPR